MDSWDQENNNHEIDDRNVTVSGQFAAGGEGKAAAVDNSELNSQGGVSYDQLSQNSQSQNVCEQEGCSQSADGNNYGTDGYGRPVNGYSRQDYGVNSYGKDVNSWQNGYQQNGYQQNSYQQSGYRQNEWQRNGYQQNVYGQPRNNAGDYGQSYTGYQQPPYQGFGYSPAEKEEPVGMGEWAGLLAIASFVPFIGIILVIVWAFSKTEKKSKSNFCKAYLIIWLIKLALAMVLFIVYGAVLASVIGR